jgi:hypothetical protein
MLKKHNEFNIHVNGKPVGFVTDMSLEELKPILDGGLEGFTPGLSSVEFVSNIPAFGGPIEIARGTLAFGLKGVCVGESRVCEVGFRSHTVTGRCVFTRIQPNDSDGPGFTDFVLYEW